MRVIFIDNGVTGTIGYYDGEKSEFLLTPTVVQQDYTKKKKNITRIDILSLGRILFEHVLDGKGQVRAVLERPMINSVRFNASVSGARALEATLTVLEMNGIPYQFCDSKEWQRGLLPSSGKKGIDSATLKKESMDIGIRLFPQHKDLIRKHKDADGILGAYQFWRKLNGSL